jgi:hypothetical protein
VTPIDSSTEADERESGIWDAKAVSEGMMRFPVRNKPTSAPLLAN